MNNKPRNALKILRKERKITQEQLAEILGVTPDYVSIIERGKQNPGFHLAKKIADIFEKTVDEIFFADETNKTFDVRPRGEDFGR